MIFLSALKIYSFSQCYLLKNTMSANPFTCALSLTVKLTLQKRLLVIIPHFLAIVLVLFTASVPNYLGLLVTLLVLISGFYYYRLHIVKDLMNSVITLNQDSMKNWSVETKDNRNKQVSLLKTSFVSNIFMVLNYADINNINYTVVFTPDSLSVGDYRHLVARLRMT